MKRCLRLAALVVVAGLLTPISEVGGVALIVGIPFGSLAGRLVRSHRVWAWVAAHAVVYAFCLTAVVPLAARAVGRVPMPCFATKTQPIGPLNIERMTFVDAGAGGGQLAAKTAITTEQLQQGLGVDFAGLVDRLTKTPALQVVEPLATAERKEKREENEKKEE